MSFATIELVIVILLIIVNGVFAMSETAFVSARKVRLQQWANEGNDKAAVALELVNSPNRVLSTVQLGITLIGILAGAFGGASIAEALAVYIGAISWLAPYSAAIALALVVLCITYLSLVIGELVPKRVALNNLERIFRLADRRVSVLMTHRPDIDWLDANATPQEISQVISASTFSRFPVCDGSLDNVLGMVHVKDLFQQCINGQPLDVKAVLQEPVYVLESASTLKVLEIFKQTGTQAALVIQEYGDIEGLITLNDILEAIVGDISSRDDTDHPQAVEREDGSWLLDGMLPIDELKDILHIRALPEEARGAYNTLAGFVLLNLGHIPREGEHFEWDRFRFEVMDMDGRRIDKVLVRPKRANDTN